VNVHQAIVVCLLRVLVHDAAGKHICHLGAVNSAHLGEDTGRRGVAAVLRVENRDGATLEALYKHVVAGRREGRFIAAPAVAVQGEEIGVAGVIRLAILGALEVVEAVEQNLTDVSGRVADGNLAGAVLGDLILDVAGDGARVGRDGRGRLLVVHDLVSGEEGQGVGVVLEGLHHGEGAVQVRGIVRLPWIETGQTLTDQRRIHVEQHIHAGGIEDAGALIVVEVRVQIVNADSVHAENLEEGSIAEADILIAEGVDLELGVVAGGAAGLVRDTDDLEAVARLGVDKVVVLGDQGRDGGRKRRAEGDERGLDLDGADVSSARPGNPGRAPAGHGQDGRSSVQALSRC
jgi:hypothetical protein